MSGKSIIIFVAGLGIGGVAGYFTKQYLYEEKFNSRLKELDQTYQEAFDELEEFYDQIDEEDFEDPEEEVDDEILAQYKESEPEPEEVEEPKPAKKKRSKKTSDEQQRAKRISKMNEYVSAKNTTDGPYVITPDDFYNGEDDFDQRIVTYFTEDDVLIDEQEDVIDNVDEIIGLASLEHISDYEPDMVYVCNEKYGVKYQVVADHRDYKAVYGINEV